MSAVSGWSANTKQPSPKQPDIHTFTEHQALEQTQYACYAKQQVHARAPAMSARAKCKLLSAIKHLVLQCHSRTTQTVHHITEESGSSDRSPTLDFLIQHTGLTTLLTEVVMAPVPSFDFDITPPSSEPRNRHVSDGVTRACFRGPLAPCASYQREKVRRDSWGAVCKVGCAAGDEEEGGAALQVDDGARDFEADAAARAASTQLQ